MNEVLFPYQIQGADWLQTKQVALLADEMGLGKSAQTITAADRLQLKRILVLCPAIARFNWEHEFQKFSVMNRKFRLVLSGNIPPVDPSDSVICSYDLVGKTKNRFGGLFDLIILDECHFLKSITTERTKEVLGTNGVVRLAKRIWALSGTPAPNHAGELWPLLYTFGQTKLSYESFIEKFCNWYLYQGKKCVSGTKFGAIPELRAVINPIILRRKKEDVMTELPPITFSHFHCTPGPVDISYLPSFIRYIFPDDKRLELFEKMRKERDLVEGIVKQCGGAEVTTQAMKALEVIAPSVSTLRRYTGLQKLRDVTKLIRNELDDGAYEKLVVFAVHRDFIEGLREKLHSFGAISLYGGMEPKYRQRNVDWFQKNHKHKVIICNIAAAGTAISLTAAHHVIFGELAWSPAANAQAAMRCHRIGQKKPVTVRIATLKDSIDEQIAYILKRKIKELTAIFDEKNPNEQQLNLLPFEE